MKCRRRQFISSPHDNPYTGHTDPFLQHDEAKVTTSLKGKDTKLGEMYEIVEKMYELILFSLCLVDLKKRGTVELSRYAYHRAISF